MIEKIKKISKWQIFVVIFFLAIFFVGLFTFKDYGISEDEKIQRNHSLVTHYYLKGVLKGNFKGDGIPIENVKTSKLEKIVEEESIERVISNYRFKYYGVALQMPLTFIEEIFDYNLDVSTIFLIRHFFTFLIFFLSLIYFYKLLNEYIVKDKKYALIGVLFLVLSPRIYGESFYNIKDNVFMSMCIINLFYSFKYINKSSKKNLLLLCFISALTINCRVIGGIVIAMTSIFKFVIDRKNLKKAIKNFFFLSTITYIIYIIITPASWNNYIFFPIEVINFFFNYKDPYSNDIIKNLYFGNSINSTSIPWHYLPVWICITTPIMYIILSLIGFTSKIKKDINKRFKKIDKDWLLCNAILVFILLFMIIVRPTTYCGWRHFYFLYPIIIINAIIGLKKILAYKKLKKVTIVLVCINSLYLVYWMVKNHPYQYNYYSLITRKYCIQNFNTNYVRLSNIEALRYILKHNKNGASIYSDNYINDYLLTKEERDKLTYTLDKNSAMYIIDNNINKSNIDTKKYKEVFCKKMEGYRLYTIYERIQ